MPTNLGIVNRHNSVSFDRKLGMMFSYKTRLALSDFDVKIGTEMNLMSQKFSLVQANERLTSLHLKTNVSTKVRELNRGMKFQDVG